MRTLKRTSILCILLAFYQLRRVIGFKVYHHQSKFFIQSPSCLTSSSSGEPGSTSLRLGGNSMDSNYCNQDKEESAADEEKWEFDVLPDRRGTGSQKWDLYEGRNVLPMWLADADVPPTPAIAEALIRRVKSDAPLGYSRATIGVKDAVADHIASFAPPDFIPKKELAYPPRHWQLFFIPGLIQGLLISSEINKRGSAIMVLTPIYPPFLWIPVRGGCKTVEVPLKMGPVAGSNEERWTFDMDAMEAAKQANPEIRMLFLCNPHNPVGRCFTAEELRKVGEFCERHDMTIVSDEVHSQLILDEDVQHLPMAFVDGGEFSQRTITLGGPSKTYNIAGLCCSWVYIPNSKLVRQYRDAAKGIAGAGNSVLGYTATEAAYTKGEPWRKSFVSHLRTNRDLVYNFIKEKMPELRMEPMQATYLAWIDASRLGWKNPYWEFQKYGVGLNDGESFGAAGVNHVRLNFACPRDTLLEALHRMENAVKSIRSS